MHKYHKSDEPILDNTFYVLGSKNTVEASAAQLRNSTRAPRFAFADAQRYGPSYYAGRGNIRHGLAEIYFVDSIFRDVADLIEDYEPLPPFLEELLDQYTTLQFMSETAVRFYNRHGLVLPGAIVRKITRADLPRGRGNFLILPVYELHLKGPSTNHDGPARKPEGLGF